MKTTQGEALIGILTVLGLLVRRVLPAAVGIAHDRRIDRQLKQAGTGRAAAERRHAPARSAAPHRTARAA
ncbi:hypothetical protein [Streptomyces sp. NEAU-W12]|uniref:hypothetical protein n=1 Tax=Streptomyces sp. NEAU-W12 TaxID=2994668 RepID=UPI00224B646A|nr:hypothetical protein [Streptomyces sp. NEAU-W12]MCX2924338.1 hypothetical protein [Streptomyces sp. NEAU-W12]